MRQSPPNTFSRNLSLLDKQQNTVLKPSSLKHWAARYTYGKGICAQPLQNHPIKHQIRLDRQERAQWQVRDCPLTDHIKRGNLAGSLHSIFQRTGVTNRNLLFVFIISCSRSTSGSYGHLPGFPIHSQWGQSPGKMVLDRSPSIRHTHKVRKQYQQYKWCGNMHTKHDDTSHAEGI